MNKVKLTIKRIDNEYVVQWFLNGVIDENKTYYTDCKKDAINTMEAMKKENYSINNNIIFI